MMNFEYFVKTIKDADKNKRIEAAKKAIIIYHANRHNIDNYTFLTSAVQNDDDDTNVEILKVLFDAGTDIDLLDGYHHNVFYYALRRPQNIKSIKFLLGKTTIVTRMDIRYLLDHYNNIEDTDFFEFLLKEGANVNNFYIGNDKFLEYLMDHFHTINHNTLLFLLQHGANTVDSESKPLLLSFITRKKPDNSTHDDIMLIDSFIEYGFDLNYVDANSQSFLMLALQSERPNINDIMMHLLNKYTFNDINSTDTNNYTSLAFAIKNSEIPSDVVSLLLRKGADPTINPSNTTLLKILFENLYKNKGTWIQNKFYLLLQNGLDIKPRSTHAPLIMALVRKSIGDDYLEVIRELWKVDSNLNVDYKDDTGASFLIVAKSTNSNYESIKFLLGKGVDYKICCVDHSGNAKSFISMLSLDYGADKEIYERIQEIELNRLSYRMVVKSCIRSAQEEFIQE